MDRRWTWNTKRLCGVLGDHGDASPNLLCELNSQTVPCTRSLHWGRLKDVVGIQLVIARTKLKRRKTNHRNNDELQFREAISVASSVAH